MLLNKALPRLFLLIAALANVQIAVQLRTMPPVLATKFDSNGAPIAWMTAGAVATLEFAMLALFFAGFWLLPRLFAHRTSMYWRIPNRDYWLAPERRAATIEALRGLISWMGIVVLLFFIATWSRVMVRQFGRVIRR